MTRRVFRPLPFPAGRVRLRAAVLAIAALAGVGAGRAGVAPPPAAPSASPAPEGQAAPIDLGAPLEPVERDTLLRLAWRTLVGHLTDHPIQDRDLQAFDLTPRLTASRGCFITLRKGGAIRGRQGEVDATRPLYQQVIVFTRRAATRDPRFLPLTDRDLPDVTLEIAVIGPRRTVDAPSEIDPARQGIYLEKWGRGAAFLPGQIAEEHWTAERALQELCRLASLPADAWRNGARLEVFTADTFSGAEPPAAPASPSESPGGPSGVSRTREGRSRT